MGRARLHHSLKARIPILHARKYNIPSICEVLGVKKTAVYTALQDYRLYGVPWKPHGCVPLGRPRSLNGIQMREFREIRKRYPTAYYDELRSLLALESKIFTSPASISRMHRRLRLSRKKAVLHAGEANPLLQAVFMNRVGRLVTDPYQLMFIDESAKDEHTVIRRHAYGLAGERIELNAPFVRGKRYSVLPVLTLDGIIAQTIVEGSITAERFEEFLRERVVCTHQFYTIKQCLYCLDAIHHSIPWPSECLRSRQLQYPSCRGDSKAR
jgi:transposase